MYQAKMQKMCLSKLLIFLLFFVLNDDIILNLISFSSGLLVRHKQSGDITLGSGKIDDEM